jgi:hypothetical protein
MLLPSNCLLIYTLPVATINTVPFHPHSEEYTMNTRFTVLLVVFAVVSCSVRPRLYSRELAEKHIADSLRVVDSLRIVDSIRIADSCMIARYRIADSVLVKEREKKRKEAEFEMANEKYDATDTTEYTSEEDIFSSRTISIDTNSTYARLIDSLEREHDRINDVIHDNDEWFKNMKAYPVSEKIRYIQYLLQYGMKDTVQIAAYCSDLDKLYKMKYQLFCAIQNSQTGNTRTFVQMHIEKHKLKMAELSEFVIALSPEVPYYPKHDVVEQYSKQ